MIRGVALSAEGRTLYAADWSGNLVEIFDAATMQLCGYVNLQNAAAIAVVPGIIPDAPCVKAAR
jgi:sugar lactone lactonase YvrE